MRATSIRLRGLPVAACFAALASALALAVALTLSGCSVSQYIIRTETDTYTITDRDSTVIETVHNIPGATLDTTPVEPSSRKIKTYAHTNSFDSVAKRFYPNFLRMGLIEVAGLYTSGRGSNASGLFGAYGAFNDDQPSASILWRSELLRFAPLEIRLRWFNDAPNWTLGWSAYERWSMDDSSSHSFTSIASNLYVRRRFYLRDQIPYVIFAPYLGASALPSAYVNLGGELQVGSFGGLNLRAYAGLISGFNWFDPTIGGTYPYVGLGVSALDFTNRVEETEREWKYYTKTTLNACIVEGSYNGSTWGQLRFASVEFPLPFWNYHFWAGTSLVDYMGFAVSSVNPSFGSDKAGLGILPISAGYRQYLGTDGFMLEPFVEASYYPSSFVNLGARLKIVLSDGLSVGGLVGFAAGSPGSFMTQGQSFSGGYFGLTLSVGDYNNTPEKIRELRAEEIPSTTK
jgi:hypothetical protein